MPTLTIPPDPPAARAPGATDAAQEPDAGRTAARRNSRLQVLGPFDNRFEDILTPAALDFIRALHDQFVVARHRMRREDSLAQVAIGSGQDPDFLAETSGIRQNSDWKVVGPGPGLYDRRVEITGPTDRKTTVNAMNSGAQVWLADHEDALSPTWRNIIGGQVNLYDAIRRRIDFTADDGREYCLGEHNPVIVFRPRGWHLTEKNLRYTDELGCQHVASATLVDFGLYLFHNASELIAQGAGPYFYLPKLESRRGARLWEDVFCFSEEALALSRGTIRATVLIETLPAAFEMEEILYELRDHCAGLNAGRWDYLFSVIKNYCQRGRRYLLPDRENLTMAVPFMRAYTQLLVATCHRRGAYAIGGMSAFIPHRTDPGGTQNALHQVALDKRREAEMGFDGTWVAHPVLIDAARREFDAVMGGRLDQLDRLRADVRVDAAQLLDLGGTTGNVTSAGIEQNASVAVRYLESWLRGIGAVAIDGLMEDAATAEISRSQLWQWINQGALTDDGMPVTRERVEWAIDEAAQQMPHQDGHRINDAVDLLREAVLSDSFMPFLTVPAYNRYIDQPCEGTNALR